MTAAREVAADDDRATPAGVAGWRARLLVVAGLLCLVLMAVVLRLVPTLFVPSLVWGDEVYQTLEPAHRLVFGYGLIPWEFQVGMRTWLMPGLIAGLMEVSRIFGDGPQYYLPVVAVGLGLLACAPIVCVFMWCQRQTGLAAGFVAAAAVAVAPELVYFGARTLNEVAAAHVLVIGCYLTESGYPTASRKRLFAAGVVLGLVCLLRLQLAPAAAVLALWPGKSAWRTRFLALLAGGMAALAFGTVFDWLTLGSPLASVWRNLYYNLYLGVSSGFGVKPWYYYLLGELGVWAAAAPFLLLLVALGARRLPALLAAVVAVVAVHSLIAHKEYRFIYPAVVLLMVLAAIGLAQLTGWIEDWLCRRNVGRAMAAPLATIVVFCAWGAAAWSVWSHPPIAELRQRVHSELAAMAFVHTLPARPCGIGLFGKDAWVRYGGYTYLHLPVPMFWPKDDAELTAAASAFDTLLSDHPPPRQFGFEQRRCFGKICVWQRPGGCATRPMPAMWYPKRLRGMMLPPDEFEAVPRSARPAAASAAAGR